MSAAEFTLATVAQIDPNPYQPRLTPDPVKIRQLADDIAAAGRLLQPPEARINPNDPKRLQLVFGHRRLAAVKLLGWEEIPLQLVECSDREMFEVALRENVQREELTAIDRAEAIRRYQAAYPDTTQAQVGQLFGLTQSGVANLLRLLTLPAEVQAMVQEGQLPERLARGLLAAKGAAPKSVAKMARELVATPAHLRDTKVAELVHRGWRGTELDPGEFPKDQLIPGMSADIGACMDCPNWQPPSNDWGDDEDGACSGDPKCIQAKRAAWAVYCLPQVVASTGIPAAAPGEKPLILEGGWDKKELFARAIRSKMAGLRWVIAPSYNKSNSNYLPEKLTGCSTLALATVDPDGWSVYIARNLKRQRLVDQIVEQTGEKIDPESEAWKKKHEKILQAQRERQAEKIRNRYDCAWIIRTTTAWMAETDFLGEPGVGYLTELFAKDCNFADLYSDCTSYRAVAEEIKKERAGLKAGKGGAVAKWNRRQLVFQLLVHENKYHDDDFRALSEAFREIADGFGLRLPERWNRPPIHHTLHNCWTCGRFGSRDGQLLKFELAAGWQVLQKRGKPVDSVTCPRCTHARPKAKRQPANKKEKK